MHSRLHFFAVRSSSCPLILQFNFFSRPQNAQNKSPRAENPQIMDIYPTNPFQKYFVPKTELQKVQTKAKNESVKGST